MARNTGELKKRCWLAKQRLKMGYWESLKREKQQVEESGTVTGSALAAEFARVRMRRDAEVASVVPSAATTSKPSTLISVPTFVISEQDETTSL